MFDTNQPKSCMKINQNQVGDFTKRKFGLMTLQLKATNLIVLFPSIVFMVVNVVVVMVILVLVLVLAQLVLVVIVYVVSLFSLLSKLGYMPLIL